MHFDAFLIDSVFNLMQDLFIYLTTPIATDSQETTTVHFLMFAPNKSSYTDL